MAEREVFQPVAALPFIHIDDTGRVSLSGSRCGACGAVLLGKPLACSSCGSRRALARIELATRGKLHTYTIVHRSLPGVTTPFIAAVVDLDGGGSLKGTLLGVDPKPNAVRFDMPVDVVFRTTEQRDYAGRPFLTYFFVARETSS